MKELYGMRRLAGRLGLAREAAAILRGEADVELPGVREEVRREDGVEIHTVTVLNEEGSRLLGRPRGSYITCAISREEDEQPAVSALSREIGRLLPPLADSPLLLVGLGNRLAAPDSLGPAVIDRSFATNHAFLNGGRLPGWSRVCTFVPGVLGLTGIETCQAVAGVCTRLQPAAVIAVDSLAAADISRVGRTVQLSDSGIRPGSGVGGAGGELSREALGCPVLALGVPTVVDSAAVIGGVLAALKEHWSRSAAAAPPDLDDAAREYTEQRLLEDFHGTLSLTPREIDDLIESMSRVLAAAIALAVHPGCDENNYGSFIK